MGCRLLRMPTHIPVPYYAQVASPEWAEAVFERGTPAASDPAWQTWGFADPERYAYWCERACGVVCVKMCCEAFGGPALPVSEWVSHALALDGYEIRAGEDGRTVENGWRHQALADLLRGAGLSAECGSANPEQVAAILAGGDLVIASVSYELGTHRPVTRRNGHLVVVLGSEPAAGDLRGFILHNPSGRTAALRENARIDAGRFSRAFSGRIIRVGGSRDR